MADRFGGKWLYGGCVLLSSVITLLSPAAASVHVAVLIALRVLSGLGEGVMMPAVQAMIARWSPPNYHSLVVTIILAGMDAGIVVGMFLSGVLCDYGFGGGWPSAFYVCGVVGCVWSAAWFLLCYDSPYTHPRISTGERSYWETTIGTLYLAAKPPTPWRKIFTSVPVWALAIAFFVNCWGFQTLSSCLPMYMHDVLGVDMTTNGAFSAVPFFVELAALPVCGLFVDLLRSPGRLSTNVVRKMFCVVGFTLTGCFFVIMGHIGCNRALAVATVCVVTTVLSLAYPTIATNQQDLAPLHAGKIIGLTYAVANLASIAAPIAVSTLTYQQSPRSGWQNMFHLTAAVYVAGAVIFVLFGSGEHQNWADDTDLEKLHDNVDPNKQLYIWFMDVSPPGRFAPSLDVSPPGSFAPKTFRPLDVSPT